MNRTRNYLFIFIFIFIISSCGKSERDPDIKFMEEAMAEANQRASRALDYITVFDSCRILPDKTLAYYYTLQINLVKTDTVALKYLYKESAIYNFMNDSALSPLREKLITCRYVYFSPVGRVLLDFSISPDFYLTQESDFQKKVSDDKIYELLKASADFYNPQMPREIESRIVLTHVEAQYPRTLNYTCLVEGVKKKDVDYDLTDLDEIKSVLIDEIRDDKSTQLLKNNDVTFGYTYTDEDGIELYTIELVPEEYQKPPEKVKTEVRLAIDNWKDRDREDNV